MKFFPPFPAEFFPGGLSFSSISKDKLGDSLNDFCIFWRLTRSRMLYCSRSEPGAEATMAALQKIQKSFKECPLALPHQIEEKERPPGKNSLPRNKKAEFHLKVICD
tara:strand:+ start:538 stop:858 length:321 start_codon:yes stop_codon:yes gene_type:complete